MVVAIADLLARRDSRKIDIGKMQVRDQFADVGFQRSVANQIELGFGIFFFYFGKGSDNHVDAVVSGEAARTDQMRAQRSALAKYELREIDDIRDRRGCEAEFFEDIHQIIRGDYNFVDARENELARAETLEVVAEFAAVVIDQALTAAQSREKPCWSGRQ